MKINFRVSPPFHCVFSYLTLLNLSIKMYSEEIAAIRAAIGIVKPTPRRFCAAHLTPTIVWQNDGRR